MLSDNICKAILRLGNFLLDLKNNYAITPLVFGRARA